MIAGAIREGSQTESHRYRKTSPVSEAEAEATTEAELSILLGLAFSCWDRDSKSKSHQVFARAIDGFGIEMPTPNEIERLAGMSNALRPDWPIKSLRSYLSANLGHRTYRDLAVALGWICTDPATQTPARLLENGPWWAATSAHSVKAGERQKCPEHDIPLTAGNCERCTSRTADYRPGRAAELWQHVKRGENE